MTGASASDKWQLIDWQKATRIVKRTQARIVKAVKAEKWKRVRDLQRLLTRSTSAKVLAIRRVTENNGKRTPGIDGALWNTPFSKWQAIERLNPVGYKAQPVRRVTIPKSNGKKRPLGIPTMKDRAMQALYLLGLDPVSETLADPISYGFRPYRSCADAIKKCHSVLVRKISPEWILEGDIKGCFDNISHEWLLDNIPMEKGILKQWLKAGYLKKQQLFPTEAGTPQGSVISPTLANMVLDGMRKAIDDALQIRRWVEHGGWRNPFKIHLVRYADDFIITCTDKEVLEKRVKPIIQTFLTQRGLELSEEKTHLTNINDGFDFLGKNIRKYNGKLLIKPSKKNVKTFLHKIQQTIHKNSMARTHRLLYRLNEMTRGWAMYHRMDNSKQTFSYVDSRIWRMMWNWAVRRHPNKGKRWIIKRYYNRNGNKHWTLFAYDENNNPVNFFYCTSLPIKYHIQIRESVNPYDSADELYFEQRNDQIMRNKLMGRKMLTTIYDNQKGLCPICQQKITKQTGWNAHHIVPKYLGGKFTIDNIALLHPVCHIQIHHPINSDTTAAPTIGV